MVDRLISGSDVGEGHRGTVSGDDRHPRHVGGPGRSNIKVAFGSTAPSDTCHMSLVSIYSNRHALQWIMWLYCTKNLDIENVVDLLWKSICSEGCG